MKTSLDKSLRNAVYSFIVGFLITFSYGFIYNNLIIDGYKFNIENTLYGIIGSALGGILFFIFCFVVSYVIYYFKDRKINNPIE